MAMNFWNRFFGREEVESSGKTAGRRLQMVLMHDRLDMSEQDMNALREDLISVIGKYLVIDKAALDVTLTREEEGVALVANIPILNVRHQRREDTPPPEPTPEKAEPAKPEPVKPEPAKTEPNKKHAPAKNAGGNKQGKNRN